MFRFIFYMLVTAANLKDVHAEESCSTRYTELKLFEKMMEIEFKMQKVLENLGNTERCDTQQEKEFKMPKVLENSGNTERCDTQQEKGDKRLWHVIPPQLMVTDIEMDGWKMIFRAVSGNGQNVFNAWTTGEKTVEVKPSLLERSYVSHYRSKAVAQWSTLGIKYVKFAFYEQNREVASVIFNGEGSDMNDWFEKSRVTYSTWSDLTATNNYNIFSIAGHAKYDRRFQINKYYGGCEKDIGHVVVSDTNYKSNCLWDEHPVRPQFLYSKINAADVWNRRQFGRADFMAIFMKQ